MVDIHTHVLPGLDDGAGTVQEGFQMIKLAAAAGSTDLVAAPHANAHFPFDEPRFEDAFSRLSALSIGLINLYRGCDCHLTFDCLEDVLYRPAKYTINASRYLLVELADFLGPSVVWGQLKALMRARIVPIITHPERNMKHLKEWVQGGCLVEVTAVALVGRYGSVTRRATEDLMDADMVHFVASDAHDCVNRTPDLSEAHEQVSSVWGKARAQRLFVDSPAAVISNAPIDRGRGRKRKSALFSLGAK